MVWLKIFYLGLFDEGIKCTNTSPIASRHSVDLIHNQTCLICNRHPSGICSLSVQVSQRVSPSRCVHDSLSRCPSTRLTMYCPCSLHSRLWVAPMSVINWSEFAVEMRTSTSFLLLESLALTSIGVSPASCAHICALVVFPIPGGPVIITARKTLSPSFPGFLKPDCLLDDLGTEISMSA